jgi:hypothetical protein
MVDSILITTSAFVSGFILWGAIWALFWNSDDAVSAGKQQSPSPLFKRDIHLAPNHAALGAFLIQFERLFTHQHFSYRCFLRAFCVSFTFLVLFAVLQYTAAPGTTFAGSLGDLSSTDDKYFTPLLIFALIVLSNALGDWLSLGQSRYFIHLARTHRSSGLRICLLLLDAALSILIFSAHLFLFSFFAGVSVYAFEITDYEFLTMELNVDALLPIVDALLLALPTNVEQALRASGSGAVFSPMLYSTLFASIWLWLFLFVSALMRAIATIDAGRCFLQWALPVDAKPYRSLGAITGGLCAIIWWTAMLVRTAN